MKTKDMRRGLSLLEIVFFLGIATALIVLVMRDLGNKSRQVRGLEARNQILDVRRFIQDNFSCQRTTQQSACLDSALVEVPILSAKGDAILEPGERLGRYKLRALCGSDFGSRTLRIEYDKNYRPRASGTQGGDPQWEDLFDGIPVYCGQVFGDCSDTSSYPSFSSDGKSNTACFPLVTEEDFNAFMVLLRDTSDSMDDYNKKYGNAVNNNIAIQAANFNAATFSCSDSASGGSAANNLFRGLSYSLGRAGSNSGACPSSLRTYVNNLTSPRHLIIFAITDHFPGTTRDWSSSTDGVIPMFNTLDRLQSFIDSLQALPNIASVTFHGAILARNATHLNSWQALPASFGGHLEFGTSRDPSAVFADVAKVVMEKKVLREVELGGLSSLLSNPIVYLNGTRLDSSAYEIVDTRLVLSPSVEVKENDVVFIRY